MKHLIFIIFLCLISATAFAQFIRDPIYPNRLKPYRSKDSLDMPIVGGSGGGTDTAGLGVALYLQTKARNDSIANVKALVNQKVDKSDTTKIVSIYGNQIINGTKTIKDTILVGSQRKARGKFDVLGDSIVYPVLSAPASGTAVWATSGLGDPNGNYVAGTGTIFRIRVRAYQTVNNIKYYATNYLELTLPPDDNSGEARIGKFSWTAVTGATGYEVAMQEDYYEHSDFVVGGEISSSGYYVFVSTNHAWFGDVDGIEDTGIETFAPTTPNTPPTPPYPNIYIGANGNLISKGGLNLGVPYYYINVKDYGAVGDNITNDSAAISRAIAAMPERGTLFFPAGEYTTGGGYIITKPITIMGCGMGSRASDGISQINCTSSNRALFTVTADCASFQNIALKNTYAGTPVNGASGIVTYGSTLMQKVDYLNVSVYGFYIDVEIQTGAEWTMENCFIYSPVKYGVKINNSINANGGDWSMSHCYIYSGMYNADAGIRYESAAGGKIENVKINMGYGDGQTDRFATGIDIYAGADVGELWLSNVSIENVRTYAIDFNLLAGQWDQIYLCNVGMSAPMRITSYAPNTLGNIDMSNVFLYGGTMQKPAIYMKYTNDVRMVNVTMDGYKTLLQKDSCVSVLNAEEQLIPLGYNQTRSAGTFNYIDSNDTLRTHKSYTSMSWTLDSTALATYSTRFNRCWFQTDEDSIKIDSLKASIQGTGSEAITLRILWGKNSASPKDSCTDLSISSFTYGTTATSTKVIPPDCFVNVKVISLTGAPVSVPIQIKGRRKW